MLSRHARRYLGGAGLTSIIAIVTLGTDLPDWAQAAILGLCVVLHALWTYSPDADADGVPDWLESRAPDVARAIEKARAEGWDDQLAAMLTRMASAAVRREVGADVAAGPDARSPWAAGVLALLMALVCSGCVAAPDWGAVVFAAGIFALNAILLVDMSMPTGWRLQSGRFAVGGIVTVVVMTLAACVAPVLSLRADGTGTVEAGLVGAPPLVVHHDAGVTVTWAVDEWPPSVETDDAASCVRVSWLAYEWAAPGCER